VGSLIQFQQCVKDQFQQLSKGQQKVAKYLLDQPQAFAVKSAEEIGKDVGVSETTVIRFCYSLQYSGFANLQKVIREGLFLQKSSLNQYHSNKLELLEQPHFFAHAMEQDCYNIKHISEQMDEVELQKVVAHWLSFSLGLMRENVFLYKPHSDPLLSTLDRMNEGSVFLAISFHRYLKETVEMAKMAKQHGATVIGITDSQLAPIGPFSDILIPISQSKKSTLDAAPALFSLLNTIVAKVSVQDKERFERRKQKYESLNVDHLFFD
jgi:DNA-binding MurR/RpiR family transcriptional regulator